MIGLAAATQLVRSFESRSFRYLWFSDVLNGWAEQMEFVVLAWFVLTETDSPFLVGIYGSLRFGGTLFSPFYGVIADRYDRRRVFIAVRSSFIILAAIMLYLSFTERLEIWHVFVITGLFGGSRAFDGVMRETVLADVVERGRLTNAAALTRMARDVTQMVGPIIGGLMLSRAGISASYSLIAAIYLFAVIAAYLIKLPPRASVRLATSVLGDLSQTFKYIKKREVVLALLLIALLVNVTAFPMNHGLMPVFARDILGTGSTGLGILLGAYAAGALIGSLSVGMLPQLQRPGKVFIFGTVAWHIGILVLSQSKWFGPSLIVLAATGIAQSLTIVILTILILTIVAPELRGRVLGARHLAVYGLPIGILVSGAMADAWGSPVALIVNAVAGMGIIVLMQVTGLLKQLWAIRQ